MHHLKQTNPWVPYVVALVIWLASIAVLLCSDRMTAYIAVPSALYAALLAGLCRWLVPPVHAGSSTENDSSRGDGSFQENIPSDEVLKASGRPWLMALRWVVVIASIGWIVGMNILSAGGLHVPVFSQWRAFIGTWHFLPDIDGQVLQNFLMEALVPGILLFALGASARQLGLCVPARGTLKAAAACLAVPVLFIVVAFVQRRLTLLTLFWRLIARNLLSNGFSEEFVIRGVLFSHLRALLEDDWAMVAQAMVFAVLHYGIGEEHGNPLLILASIVALNLPMGLALGFMALRSRSLALPSVVHASLNAMKDLMM